MWDAGDIMGLNSDKVTWSMRFAVGFANALYGLATTKWFLAWVPFIIPIDWIARNAYYYIFANDEERAEYDKNHEEWEKDMEKLLAESEEKIKRQKALNDRIAQEMLKIVDGAMDMNDDSGWNSTSIKPTSNLDAEAAEVEGQKLLAGVPSDELKKKGQENSKKYTKEGQEAEKAKKKAELEKKIQERKLADEQREAERQAKKDAQKAKQKESQQRMLDAMYGGGFGPATSLAGKMKDVFDKVKTSAKDKISEAKNKTESGSTTADATTTASSGDATPADSAVSNIREYEAGARNDYTDSLNRSVYGDSADYVRNLNLSQLASSIGGMFGIDMFGKSLSEGGAEGFSGDHTVYTGTPDNRKLQERAKDPKFRKNMQDMWNYASSKWGPDVARNMLAISYSESKWRQDAYNETGGAAGMFQVIPKYRPAWGFGINEDPRTFTPAEQIARVGPKLMSQLGKHKPTVHNLYAILHYPKSLGYTPDQIVYSRGSLEYKWNHGLDRNKDGHVKAGEVTEFAAEAYPQTKKAALAMGLNGYVVDKFNPYSVSQGGIMDSTGATKSQSMGLQAGYGPIRHVNQTSNKWNKLSMGGLSFKEAGCGPAVMAMLLDKLDIKYDMNELVSKAVAMKKGAMGGTPMTYFKSILSEHGVQSAILTSSVVKRFIAELRAGKSPILLTVSSTGAPHFIIGKEIKNGRIYINDPEKTSSEAITLNDIRLRKAKAILVYKVKGSVKNKIRNMVDIVKGGYGAIKSYVLPKLEGFGNAREAIYNTVERMVQKGAYGPAVINNNIASETHDTSKVVKAISKAQTNNKNVTDLLSSIDSNIERMSKGRDNEQTGDNSILSSILAEVKNTNMYLAKLVEVMAGTIGGNKNFTVNGRQVMQTIGGIPQPVTSGVSPDTIDFYKTVDRIVRGQAL